MKVILHPTNSKTGRLTLYNIKKIKESDLKWIITDDMKNERFFNKHEYEELTVSKA